jgi:hypothetical protein
MEISEQIATLESINRLIENEDFQKQLAPYFQQLFDNSHSAIINPETTGAGLEFARARYVAARELKTYLHDKKTALERAIKNKQAIN